MRFRPGGSPAGPPSWYTHQSSPWRESMTVTCLTRSCCVKGHHSIFSVRSAADASWARRSLCSDCMMLAIFLNLAVLAENHERSACAVMRAWRRRGSGGSTITGIVLPETERNPPWLTIAATAASFWRPWSIMITQEISTPRKRRLSSAQTVEEIPPILPSPIRIPGSRRVRNMSTWPVPAGPGEFTAPAVSTRAMEPGSLPSVAANFPRDFWRELMICPSVTARPSSCTAR
mmetsp:Transcript_37594/g.88865  ORF Transcript_37594/g.88865 Transcript_37594/m.88865 type:complete len:232 (-) Transcript_37594:536-1231(-)